MLSTRRIWRLWLCVAALWLLCSVATAPAHAQEAAGPAAAAPAASPAAELTLKDIDARAKEAEAIQDLPEDVKKQVAEHYRSAREQLQLAQSLRQQGNELDALLKSAPDRIDAIRKDLAASPRPARPDVPPDATMAQLVQLSTRRTRTSKSSSGAWPTPTRPSSSRRRCAMNCPSSSPRPRSNWPRLSRT